MQASPAVCVPFARIRRRHRKSVASLASPRPHPLLSQAPPFNPRYDTVNHDTIPQHGVDLSRRQLWTAIVKVRPAVTDE